MQRCHCCVHELVDSSLHLILKSLNVHHKGSRGVHLLNSDDEIAHFGIEEEVEEVVVGDVVT